MAVTNPTPRGDLPENVRRPTYDQRGRPMCPTCHAKGSSKGAEAFPGTSRTQHVSRTAVVDDGRYTLPDQVPVHGVHCEDHDLVLPEVAHRVHEREPDGFEGWVQLDITEASGDLLPVLVPEAVVTDPLEQMLEENEQLSDEVVYLSQYNADRNCSECLDPAKVYYMPHDGESQFLCPACLGRQRP